MSKRKRRSITIDEIREICELIAKGYTNSEICNMTVGYEKNLLYHSQYSLVSDIRCHRRHHAISKDYRFPKIGEITDGVLYYPGRTYRSLSDVAIEKICIVLLTEKNPKIATRKISVILMLDEGRTNGAASAVNDIYILKYHILHGLLYNKIYNKCAAQLGIKVGSDENRHEYPTRAHKLTSEQIKQISELISNGLNNCEIADIVFGDDPKKKSKRTTISKIRNRLSYSDETEDYVFPKDGEICSKSGIVYRSRSRLRKKPEAMIRDICASVSSMRGKELTDRILEIYTEYGMYISRSSISPMITYIRHGKLYRDIYKEYK